MRIAGSRPVDWWTYMTLTWALDGYVRVKNRILTSYSISICYSCYRSWKYIKKWCCLGGGSWPASLKATNRRLMQESPTNFSHALVKGVFKILMNIDIPTLLFVRPIDPAPQPSPGSKAHFFKQPALFAVKQYILLSNLVYINIQNESGRKRLYLSSKVNGNFIFVSVNKGEYQKSIFVEINEIHERSLSLGEAKTRSQYYLTRLSWEKKNTRE